MRVGPLAIAAARQPRFDGPDCVLADRLDSDPVGLRIVSGYSLGGGVALGVTAAHDDASAGRAIEGRARTAARGGDRRPTGDRPGSRTGPAR